MSIDQFDLRLFKRFLELAKHGTSHIIVTVGDKLNTYIVTIKNEDIYARPG